jgi:hypothetical protein
MHTATGRSGQVRHTACDMKPHGDMFPPE